MKNYSLAIELGTQYTAIYQKGKGILIKEPSLVAIEIVGKRKKFVAVGIDAQKLIKNPKPGVTVFEPVVEGVVINKQIAMIMIKELLKKMDINKISKHKAIFVIPVGLETKDKNKLLSLGYALNFHTVTLLPSSIASLVGMDADMNSVNSHLVVSVGAGVSDVSVITQGAIVRGASITVAGKSLSSAIARHIREKYSTIVGEEGLHEINTDLVSLFESDANKMVVVGTDADTRNVKKITISSREILPIVTHFFEKITECINAIINVSSSQVVADVSRLGIYVCGGLSQISGLENYLRKQLKYPVYIDADPSNTTIYGAGVLIEEPELLKKVIDNL